MTEKEAYRSLLLQKKELVFKLLRLSNDAVLTEPSHEQNVENYTGLVDVREKIIEELKTLDGDLYRLGEPPGMSEETTFLNQEMKEMADQIARLELDIRGKASGVMAHLQRELTVIKNRKRENGSEYTPGMLFQNNA